MRIPSKAGVKIAVAAVLVIVIGLSVNALTSPYQTPGAQYLPLLPGPIFQPAIKTVVTRGITSTVTATTTIQALAEGQIGFSSPAGLSLAGPTERMEIFSARLSIEVKDVKPALTQVAAIAQQLDGYVAGSSASVFGDREAAAITIRVPRDKFYQAVDEVESLGKLKDKATQSDEVTQEYIDITARRGNLQKQEKRLQEILDLAKNVEDVLNVERELERVRGEIETLTGRINYLENNVALSTIMATFTQPVETPLPELDWTEPFKTGIAFLYSTVRGLVIFAFAAAPFVAIGGPGYIIYRRRRNRIARGAVTKT